MLRCTQLIWFCLTRIINDWSKTYFYNPDGALPRILTWSVGMEEERVLQLCRRPTSSNASFIFLFRSSQAYLEPRRTSMMKPFCKNSKRLKVVYYFRTFLIRLWSWLNINFRATIISALWKYFWAERQG